MSSCVPRPSTWPAGNSSRCAARYVSTSTGLETTSTIASGLCPAFCDFAENAAEQLDVAIDQIEPAFVGLAPQAGGDADQIAVGNVFVAAGGDQLIGHQRRAVQQVERLPGGQVGIDVDQRDLADDAAHLQARTPCTNRPDPPPPIMLTFIGTARVLAD